MIRSNLTCAVARDFLDRPGAGQSEALLEHVHQCEGCQEFFHNNEAKFLEILDRDPLGKLGDLAIAANRRVGAPGSKGSGIRRAPTWSTPEIEGYLLGEQIGQTQGSKVYVATQLSLQRQVALKVVKTGKSGVHQYTLAREAAMMAWLKSPYILTIHETGIWQEGIWLALEYCPKGSLSDALASGERYDEREAADLIRKVASGVQVANRQGFIHRDIKPGNILLDQGNQPKLADFGLAKNAEEIREEALLGSMAGTPSYMAPEQIMNQAVDARADVYGLGAVLYHLLTGHAPFRAGSQYEAMLLAAHTPPLAPMLANAGLSKDLNHICMKCLAKDPGQRYPSAKDLADDLQRFLEGETVRARPLGRLEGIVRWASRNRALSATLTAGFLFLVAALTGFAALSIWALAERDRATRNESRVVEQNRLAEARGYRGNIQRADQELEQGSTKAAEDHLTSCPIPLRKWEHDYITWKLRQNQVALHGHLSDVNCVALGADGIWLVSGSDDGAVRLWNAETGEGAGVLIDHQSAIGQLYFTPDSDRLLVGSENGKLLVWNTNTHALEEPLAPGKESPTPASKFGKMAAVTPDGKMLVTEGPNHCMTVWDIEGRKLVRKTDWNHDKGLMATAVSRSGKLAASSEDKNRVVLWAPGSGKILLDIRSIPAVTRSLAFSPDEKVLATGSTDNIIRLWDTQNGKLLHTLEGHVDWIRCLAFSPDGAWLASGADDHFIKIWDPLSGNEIRTYRGHNDLVRCLCFSPDGNRLISGGMDHTVRIWDLSTSQEPRHLLHPDKARAVQFSPDGKLVATGCDDGTVRLWNPEIGKQLNKLQGHKKVVECLKFSPKGDSLASGGEDGNILIWKPSNGLLLAKLDGKRQPIRGLGYSPGGEMLYSIGLSGFLQVWDLNTGNLYFETRAHSRGGTALAVSQDGKFVATGGTDQEIHLWDTESWKPLGTLKGHEDHVLSLAFSPDGRYLASGSDDRSILVWDLESGIATRRLSGHKGGVTSLQFSWDGARLLSSSFDNTVKIWDAVEGMDILTVTRHRNNARMATFSTDGKNIASASDDGSVILRKTTTPLESLLLQSRRGRIVEAGFEEGGDLIQARDNLGNIFHCDPLTGLEISVLPGHTVPDGAVKTTRSSVDKKWFIEEDQGEFLVIDAAKRKARLQEDRQRLEKWTRVHQKPKGN